MKNSIRRRFWIEVLTAWSSGALSLLTAVQPAWIERVFPVDPDASSGSLEWLMVALLFAVAIAAAAVARGEWRRAPATP